MKQSDRPGRRATPWASQAGASYVRSVPDSGAPSGAASYAAGFPPETFQPIASGGTPPAGQDFNGVLFDVTAMKRWVEAGGTAVFDQTFANAVGGYPAGAMLASTTPGYSWQSLIDSNNGDPDGGAAGWIRLGGITQEGQLRQSISSPNSYSVSFPFAFPNACTAVAVTGFNSTASSRRDVFPQIVSTNVNGFSFVLQQTGDTNVDPTLDGIDWIARGR